MRHFTQYTLVFLLFLTLLCAAQVKTPPPPVAALSKSMPVEVKSLPNGTIKLGQLTLHRDAGCLSFPAKIIDPDNGTLEVLIATPEGRLHETLLVTDVLPLHLQTMLYLLGAKNGPRLPDKNGFQGGFVDIDLEWTDTEGEKHIEPIENWVKNTQTGKLMKRRGWVFTGSRADNNQLQADTEGNLVLVYSVGATILDIPSREGEDDTFFVINYDREKTPGPGAQVRVIVTPRPDKPANP